MATSNASDPLAEPLALPADGADGERALLQAKAQVVLQARLGPRLRALGYTGLFVVSPAGIVAGGQALSATSADGLRQTRPGDRLVAMISEVKFAEQVGNYHLWLRLLLRKAGLERIPQEGPAILVCNHVVHRFGVGRREQSPAELGVLEHAADAGANALIGVRYDANEVAQGVTEVLAYGTAVEVERT